MIWFAGILQNTCCNRINENKTKKNTELCVVFLHNFAHSLTWSHMHQTECVLLRTHKWLIFHFRYADNHYFSIFLDSLSIFFLEHILLGGPLQDRTFFFSCPWTTFLGCVLEETHGTTKCRLEICNWVVRN